MSTMKNRHTFSKYVYNLHETVNKMLNKSSGLTYDTVRERYEHFRSRCTKKKQPKRTRKKERGCITPLHGANSKCVITIVPKNKKCKTLRIDRKCIRRLN